MGCQSLSLANRFSTIRCHALWYATALLSSAPSSVTIIKDTAGRYFANFVVEVGRPELQSNTKSMGIDLGLASLTIISDGEKITLPKVLRSTLRRPGPLQRSLSRKVKDSGNRSKARLKVAKARAAVADKRPDVLHKLGTRLIHGNRMVALEDLNVSGILKNRKLARAIADAGWRMLRTLLEAKAEQYGREMVVVKRKTVAPAAGRKAVTHLNQEVQRCTT